MVRAPMMQPACAGIQAKVNGMVGDCKPLGYFDPFGFAKDASPATMNKCVPACFDARSQGREGQRRRLRSAGASRGGALRWWRSRT